MPRKRYSEETRRQVMQEMEQGKAVDEVIRRHGIAEATYYRWRAQFRPIRTRDDAVFRQLEEENRQLRDICAEFGSRNTAVETGARAPAPRRSQRLIRNPLLLSRRRPHGWPLARMGGLGPRYGWVVAQKCREWTVWLCVIAWRFGACGCFGCSAATPWPRRAGGFDPARCLSWRSCAPGHVRLRRLSAGPRGLACSGSARCVANSGFSPKGGADNDRLHRRGIAVLYRRLPSRRHRVSHRHGRLRLHPGPASPDFSYGL